MNVHGDEIQIPVTNEKFSYVIPPNLKPLINDPNIPDIINSINTNMLVQLATYASHLKLSKQQEI